MPEKRYDKFTVVMTNEAKRDLTEIIRYIAKSNPHTALMIMDRLKAKISKLKHFPHRGAYVRELQGKTAKKCRQITEPPWKIIYKVDDKTVHIMAIIDSGRNLEDILVRKFLKF